MKKFDLELIVGCFVLLGIAGLAYLSINFGELEWGRKGYDLVAEFSNIGGLKSGAQVEIAGV